jgi:polyribonucleotide nucleotidyltransferase
MGLASNKDMSRWEVLTDIQDLEDGQGGMDFKIAGTRDGITAIQLDTKTIGLDKAIIEKTLIQGLKARQEILDVMDAAISVPRPELSPYAPRIVTMNIDPEKIREVIGAGGKVINKIVEATGVTIDIEQDGTIFICGTNQEKTEEAIKWIDDIVREFKAGEIFTGKVVRMLDFGAFIELTPGRDGMVHVSELAPYRVGKPSDFMSLGDTVTVKVKEIDDQGRVNLTMLGLKENEPMWADEKGKQTGDFMNSRRDYNGPRRGHDDHRGGGRRDDRRGGRR